MRSGSRFHSAAILLIWHCTIVAAYLPAHSYVARCDDNHPSITGQISFKGKASTKLEQTKSVSSDTMGGLRWVLASYFPANMPKVEASQRKKDITRLNLTGGTLSPFVSLARVGGQLEITNNENKMAIIKLSGVDLIESDFIAPKSSLLITIQAPEASPGICVEEVDGAHRRAWVVAPDTSYAAITDDEGRFTIANAPAGSGVIRFWHPVVRFHRILKLSQLQVNLEPGTSLTIASLVLTQEDID